MSCISSPEGFSGYQRGPSREGYIYHHGQIPRPSIRQLATSEACTDASSSDALAQKKKKVIILTGATAVGKTKASIELAQRVGGEIISADSVQVYRGLDVGSDKVSPCDTNPAMAGKALRTLLFQALMTPYEFCRSCLVRGEASLTTSSTYSLPAKNFLLRTSTALLGQQQQTS